MDCRTVGSGNVAEDREGSLWIGTDGGGLNRLRHGKFTIFTPRDGLPGLIVQSVFVDSRNDVWVGTTAAGGTVSDGKFATFRFGMACPATRSNRSARTGTATCGSALAGAASDG